MMGHVNLSKDIKRKTLFIETSDDEIYLPRPNGWICGWARHKWVTHLMNKSPKIASPGYWKMLSENYATQKLVEYNDGQTKILSVE